MSESARLRARLDVGWQRRRDGGGGLMLGLGLRGWYRRTMRCTACGHTWSDGGPALLTSAVECPRCWRWTGLPLRRGAGRLVKGER